MIADGGQVVLAEAAVDSGQSEDGVDAGGADQRGQLDRADHLGAEAGHPGSLGLDEPRLGARADGQEAFLGLGLRAWFGLARPVAAGMVCFDEAGSAGGGQLVALQLGQPTAAGLLLAWTAVDTLADDDQFFVVDATPDLAAFVPGRDRVAGIASADGAVVADQAFPIQRQRMGIGRQRVKTRTFFLEHLGGRQVGRAVHPVVELLDPPGARALQLGEDSHS
ncbi:hypothetical protein ACWEJ6_49135 [Nonomuraea sp. NPDC004702]